MSGRGDYDDEMLRRTRLDEEAFEALVAGHQPAADDLLASFVEDVQLATMGTTPEPTPALATLFTDGLSTEKGDLPATAASNVTGPAPQAAGLPKWRKRTMIETALAKLASLGLAAKLGVAAGAVTLAGSAAAATGTLPGPAQDRVADAVEHAGIDIPGGRSAEHRQDADHRQDGEQQADTGQDAGTADADVPADADFGTGVSDGATSGAPQEDGAQFGEDVSNDARETFPPDSVPTADDNPGSEFSDGAPSEQPEETPTAEENPGAQFGDGAPSEQPDETPTAEDNPGSGFRP